MKRLTGILLTCIIVLNSTMFSLGAANILSQAEMADKLYSIGMFRGSEKGFELKNIPTRTHSAVMLVRALGMEEYVLNNRFTHPFTDVPTYANSYVGYLFQNNLTTGISSTKFGANDPITSRQYTTFMLRALGYSDKDGDFDYRLAIEFAKNIDVLSNEQANRLNANSRFTRGDMVEVTYASLNSKTKGTNLLLIERIRGFNALKEDNVVERLNNINRKLTAEEIGSLAASVVTIYVVSGNDIISSGSGFYYDKGKLVTNFHVIENAPNIVIKHDDGFIYDGRVFVTGYDKDNDLATLQIDNLSNIPIPLGDSSKLARGQIVYAIGSPSGLTNTLSNGIISSIREDIIQTTAPISPGSSGGVLLNEYGHAVGVTTFYVTSGQNLNFAMPINLLSKMNTNRKLTLAEFNKEANPKPVPPKNVRASLKDNNSVLLSWDNQRADYYKVYESINAGPFYELISSETGLNRWMWFEGYSIEITDHSPGSFVQYKVTTVFNGVESVNSNIATIQIPSILTNEELERRLLQKYPSINLNGYTVKIKNYAIDDNSVFMYIESASLPTFIDAHALGRQGIANSMITRSRNISNDIGSDILLVLMYTDFYDFYPSAFVKNEIFDTTVTYNTSVNKWFVFYPLVQVYSNNNHVSWFAN